MSENAAELKCPRCGAVLDAAVANGICPACLLKQAALGTGADSFPAMPWTPPSVDELASAFPQLEVLELIGHGGMGAVYKARQKSLGRLVALKILAPQHAANPDFAERFAREAKVLAEVSHPNIVTVHDFGQAGDFYFLTMEFVDGVNLRQAMKAGRLTPQQALAIVPPICEALQFAHDRGIVHRDIKPENLLLDKEGRVKIADFGIARMLRGGARSAVEGIGDGTNRTNGTDKTNTSHSSSQSYEIGLTQESVIGTPSYMAPEQRDRPASVDHRADIFSLGVVLYEMLTGELPGAKLQPPSKKVQIDVRLDEIVLRALDVKPELRFHTATEFREQVEGVVATPTRRIPRPDEPIISGVTRSTRCHVTTPKQLATLSGQLFLWRNLGQLVLNDQQMVITQGANVFAIPLSAIRDLSIGRYPLLVNPIGLDFIRVTYEVDGQSQQLYFTPHEGLVGLPSQFNDSIACWLDVLREAVIAATGHAPSQAPVPAIGLPTSPRWGLSLLVALCLIFVAFQVLLFQRAIREADSQNGLAWVFCLAPFLGLLVPIFFRLLSRARDRRYLASKSQEVDPSQRRRIAIAASIVWLIFCQTLGTFSIQANHILMRYDTSWILLTLFMLVSSVLPGIVVSNALKRASRSDSSRTPSIYGWLKAIAVAGCVLTLPFVIFSVGFADGMLSQALTRSGLGLLLLVPMTLVGFFALPWASIVLWQARWRMCPGNDAVALAMRRRTSRWMWAGFGVLSIGVVWLIVPAQRESPAIEVLTRAAQVVNGHFEFDYDVASVPGWNVWLTLENAQLFRVDDSQVAPRGPAIVSRYQAKLSGKGRVRVPSEYLPTSNEGRGKMLASIGPWEGDRSIVRQNIGVSRLAYQTESLMRVWAILTVLPEGQSPDSLLDNEPRPAGTPRFKTIEPPAKPKLGPFEGAYQQGRVEVFALSDHPPKGQHWKPNGELLTEAVPDAGGSSTVSGMAMKEIVIRVHSETGNVSWPVLRFPPKSGFIGMGISFHSSDAKQPYATMIATVPCPPDAREVTIEVGVADGEWRKAIEFARHDNQPHSSARTSGGQVEGTWAGSVRSASIVGDRVPIAFSYSRRDDYETRMTYERDDGTIVPLIGEGSDSNGDMTNALTTLPVAEFQRIQHFRVESRRYQWIEFRNVSLELGHRTSVEVQSAK